MPSDDEVRALKDLLHIATTSRLFAVTVGANARMLVSRVEEQTVAYTAADALGMFHMFRVLGGSVR